MKWNIEIEGSGGFVVSRDSEYWPDHPQSSGLAIIAAIKYFHAHYENPHPIRQIRVKRSLK